MANLGSVTALNIERVRGGRGGVREGGGRGKARENKARAAERLTRCVS